jgi:outer membrane protein TolC
LICGALWASGSAAASGARAVSAGDTLRLSLEDAVRIALERGPDVRYADAGVRAAAGRVREAAAAAFPQVSGSATYTRKIDSIFEGVSADTGLGVLFRNSPFAAVNSWSADLTASQVLLSRRVGAGIAAARAYRSASEWQRREVREAARFAARRAYHEAAAEVLAIAESSLALARAHFRDVDLWYRQGARAEYDRIRAEVDVLNEEPAVVAARNAVATSMLELKRLLDLPSEQPVALTTPPRLDEDRVPVPDLGDPSPSGRAALAAAEANVELRRRALAAERGERWPTLVASATLSHQAYPSDVWPAREQFRRDLQASLQLDYPLFLGLRTFGAVQRAGAELRQAEIERDRTRRDVELDLDTARQETRRMLAVLAARRGAARLAARAHRIATVRYAGGLGTELEVSDARLQLRTAEVNEVLAARDYLTALARLEYALGAPPRIEMKSLDELSFSQEPTR